MRRHFSFLHCKTYLKWFSNPSNDKYSWQDAEKAELIFLNNFKWSPEMIAWKDLLVLLEGQQTVHLPSSRNHYAHDIQSNAPIVATGKSEIKYICKFSSTDPVEDKNDVSQVETVQVPPSDFTG